MISTIYYPNSAEEGLADFQKDLAGKVLTVEFELSGNRFVAINAGSEFKFNEGVSLKHGRINEAPQSLRQHDADA